MKLMVVFGARPEVIKLAPVISEARRRAKKVELQICSTGQHREILDQAMAVFSINLDIELAAMRDYTERSEGVNAELAMLTGTSAAAIIHTAGEYLNGSRIKQGLAKKSNPYGDDLASKRITFTLLGRPTEAFHG
jgi:UDP-N-acetylglucosamine 2-epimerase